MFLLQEFSHFSRHTLVLPTYSNFLKAISSILIMVHMKHAGPLNLALIPESTPSKLHMRDFLKAWTAIDAHTNFMVRYPQMDELDVTQVSE